MGKIATLLIIILLFFEDVFNYNISFFSYFDELIVVVLLFGAIYKSIKNKIKFETGNIFTILVLFIVIGLLGLTINSPSFESGFGTLLSTFLTIKVFLLIIGVSNVGLNKKTISNFIWSMKFALGINIVFMILQVQFYNSWLNFFPYETLSEQSRFLGLAGLQGLLYFPGTSGSLYLVITIICYCQHLVYKAKYSLIQTAIFGFAAIFSFRSKIIISIFIISIVGEFFIRKTSLKEKVLRVCILAFPLVGFILIFGDYVVNQFIYYTTSETTVTARYALSQGARILANQFNPLGVGFGQYGDNFAKVHYSSWYYNLGLNFIDGLNPFNPMYATDTWWPMILGETGYLGFILFILMLVIICFYIIKSVINSKKQESNLYFINLITLFVTFQMIIESFASQVFVTNPNYIIWGVLVGLLIYANKHQNNFLDNLYLNNN